MNNVFADHNISKKIILNIKKSLGAVNYGLRVLCIMQSLNSSLVFLRPLL